jgi:two-component system, NarL family, sensor kinase
MENKSIEVLNLLIITTFVIFTSITFVFAIIFKLKKKQLLISNSIKIMKLNHENEILTSQIEIQESTFSEIAREIHDNISLTLTLAKLNLNTLIINEDQEDIEKINNSIDLISKSLIDLNNLSKSIDGDIIEKFGLITALQNEINGINKIGAIDIILEIFGNDRYLEHTVELAIFRIIQEGIKNSITHAKAKSLTILIDFHDNEVFVCVTDDGIGFDIEKEKPGKISAGLKNMRNRAKLINAKFSILSSLGNGTKIQLVIPILSRHA